MKRRPRTTEYGLQLREKQKAKRTYGILEKQFRGYFIKAAKQKGVTGENLLRMLETRLDNVVYRLGFAASRNSARQLIRHRHITVNGKRVTIPSYLVAPGASIAVNEKAKRIPSVQHAVQSKDKSTLVPYMSLEEDGLTGKLVSVPRREDIPVQINEQLIVELYSK